MMRGDGDEAAAGPNYRIICKSSSIFLSPGFQLAELLCFSSSYTLEAYSALFLLIIGIRSISRNPGWGWSCCDGDLLPSSSPTRHRQSQPCGSCCAAPGAPWHQAWCWTPLPSTHTTNTVQNIYSGDQLDPSSFWERSSRAAYFNNNDLLNNNWHLPSCCLSSEPPRLGKL